VDWSVASFVLYFIMLFFSSRFDLDEFISVGKNRLRICFGRHHHDVTGTIGFFSYLLFLDFLQLFEGIREMR